MTLLADVYTSEPKPIERDIADAPGGDPGGQICSGNFRP